MKWAELTIETCPEAVDGIADALRAEGARGVAEERVDSNSRLTAYLPSDRRLRRRVQRVSERIRRLQDFGVSMAPGTIGLRQLEAGAWSEAWKDHFQIIRISPRLVIRPSWLDYRAAAGEAVVVLDPGMGFGTGSHPTTRLCLQALCDHLQPVSGVIDVGTGSGILALAAAALGASRVVAIDEDDLALAAARANIRRNRLGRRISLRKGDLLRGHSATAELIVANIVAEALIEMAPTVSRCITPGGIFIGSGLTAARAGWVEDALVRAGLHPAKRLVDEGWAAVLARSGVSS